MARTIVKERGILMAAPMVLATNAGIKTQTRRALKAESAMLDPQWPLAVNLTDAALLARCRYGKPGDRLWVREAWRSSREFDRVAPRDIPRASPVVYPADDGALKLTPLMGKLRPGMFMCRWMSRILLEVVSVRVERLQDISEADCIAEGAPGYQEGVDAPPPDPGCEWSYRASYRRLWESINGPGSGDANPFVWVVEFRRVDAR